MNQSPIELAKALNETVRLLEKRDKNSTLRAEEMRRSLQASYRSIKLIISDLESLKNIEYSRSDCERLVSQIACFESVFVAAENAVLNKAGVGPKAKKQLIRQARNKRKTLFVSGDFNDGLINYLNETREALGRVLDDFNRSKEVPLDVKKLIQKDWRRISFLVGGAALVAIDTAFAANPAIAAVSALFGKEMITNNLKDMVAR